MTVAFIVISFAADARMYQWVDPDNGTTQLSGKPPVWYRSDNNGPRVFVFENGKLIDDTGISVSATERESLRQQALLKAEEDRTVAREKLLEAKKLQAVLNPAAGEEQPMLEREEIQPETGAPQEKAKPATEQETVDRMKALIQEWETQRTQTAKELIQPGVKK